MAMAPVIRTEDLISGRDAKAFATINGERHVLMRFKSFRARVEMNLASVSRLGAGMAGHKEGLPSGSWNATCFYVSTEFRDVVLQYVKKKLSIPVTFQVTNDGTGGQTGRQTTLLYGCKVGAVDVAAFDADAPVLEEDMNGTFEDYNHSERFRRLPGS